MQTLPTPPTSVLSERPFFPRTEPMGWPSVKPTILSKGTFFQEQLVYSYLDDEFPISPPLGIKGRPFSPTRRKKGCVSLAIVTHLLPGPDTSLVLLRALGRPPRTRDLPRHGITTLVRGGSYHNRHDPRCARPAHQQVPPPLLQAPIRRVLDHAGMQLLHGRGL